MTRFSTGRASLAVVPPVLILALAACDFPAGPAFDPSPEARAAPRPALGETEPFRAALATAGPDLERMSGEAEALGIRAAEAQARGDALGGPVIDPARRERLLRAATGGTPPQP